MLISEDYRRLNKQLHEDRPDYGMSGHKWAPTVDALAVQVKAKTILDYGCGKGTLAENLTQQIAMYDPSIPGFDASPEPADVVACTDVLEHIEPDCLDAVLDDLKRVTRQVGLFVIATRPAAKTLADGRNAHLIVKSLRWWCDKLFDRFEIKQMNDLGSEVIFIVAPVKH